jgi:hypothetical protein
VRRDTLRNRGKAQRVPSARQSFVDVSRECAQTSWALIARNAGFSADSVEGGGLKNRCTFERKSWILQVLISRTLTVCGEVAERLKAAVC